MPFKPGQSGNPSGRVKGAKEFRNQLNQQFLRALLSDFEVNGVKAIDRMRKEDPASYVRVVASVLPKEIGVTNNIGDLSDEQLADVIAALQSAISAGIVKDASGAAGGAVPAKDVSALH